MRACSRCGRCYEESVELCPVDGIPSEPLFSGDALIDGKYRLIRQIGQGGMGMIFEAVHAGLQRRFAVKLIRRVSHDPRFVARFRVEAEALGKLHHDHIVDVTDFGIDPRDGGLPYLVMELLEGTSLLEMLSKEGRLTPRRAIPLLRQTAAAIDYAHRNGVLHRDLKPGNVFVVAKEERALAKVVDFGLAALVGEMPEREDEAGSSRVSAWVAALTRPLASPDEETAPIPAVEESTAGRAAARREPVIGTVPYMAPELFLQLRAGKASDIYAFGILCYELLTGRLPFDGNLEEIVGGHLGKEPARPSAIAAGLGSELDDALLAPLRKDAAKRPATATAVVDAIEHAAGVVARRRWRRRELPRRFGLAAAIAAMVAIGAGALRHVSAIEQLENVTLDARLSLRASHPPDPSLMVVTVDDATLASSHASLTEMAARIGTTSARALDSGAEHVAIDFLLPESWSRSVEFSDLVLRHAGRLTLAAFSARGEVVGPECVSGLTAAALGERAPLLFGFVNLGIDSDGKVRKAVAELRDVTGARREAFASHAVRSRVRSRIDGTTSFWIDTAIDSRRIERHSWNEFESALRKGTLPTRGRIIFVGGDFAGSGDEVHSISAGRGAPREVSGVVLQALIANTILAGLPLRSVGSAGAATILFVAALLCAFAPLWNERVVGAVAMAATVAVMIVLSSGMLLVLDGRVMEVAAPLASAVAALMIGLIARRRLTPFGGADED
jgi:serine/threonine protein kinase/CHASE2 domain-containing sensor protein